MNKVIADYCLDICFGHEVSEIKREEGRFLVPVPGDNKVTVDAATVIIAIGIFGKPVKPSSGIPREVQDRICFSIPDYLHECKQNYYFASGIN